MKNLVLREENFGWVAYDTQTKDTFFLNNTAKEIYDLLKKGLNKEDIINKISSEYDIDKNIIIKDFEEFMKRLENGK